MNQTLYQELGVEKDATADEIKSAYRKLAMEFHPDKTGGDVIKAERFKAIAKAYEILSDEDRRLTYDTCGKDLNENEKKTRVQTMLAQLFMGVIDNSFVDSTQIIEVVSKAIQTKISETYRDCRTDSSRLDRFKAVKESLSYDGEGPSQVIIALDQNIKGLEDHINNHKANIILYNEMLSSVEDYSMKEESLSVT